MTNPRRLIEAAFPLREASLDSVHEKNVRHGHISTLHIWPARRPLAACRAALLATLLPDPGTEEGRRNLRQRIGGLIEEKGDADGRMKEETVGGILHWGREGGPELQAFREEIKSVFRGRTPRVLDPFAGGGAIPLEAMRLGCEATASDINPVAWFILRCTLHYPRLVGTAKRPLPAFVKEDAEFLDALGKAHGIRRTGRSLFASRRTIDAEFAWHLRAWGRRVLERARKRLAARYPTYAEFEPVRRKGRSGKHRVERSFPPRGPRLLEPNRQGRVSTDALNEEFDAFYLDDDSNPRWVAKPIVAYLWARTVPCGDCRAEVPLLKTRWLCKKSRKRVLLTMEVRENGSGVQFGVEQDVLQGVGNSVQRREHDQRIGAGTMTDNGVRCPCCGALATMGDLRAQGRAGRLGERMTAVVVDGQQGKEYRLPTEAELKAARVGAEELESLYAEIPFGIPDEPTPKAGIGASRAFSVDGYGFDRWRTLFTDRQLLALGTLVTEIRSLGDELAGYPPPWRDALSVYLVCILDKFAAYSSSLCIWVRGQTSGGKDKGETLGQTFTRWALPIVWDFCEVSPLSHSTGSFNAMTDWVVAYVARLSPVLSERPGPTVLAESASSVVGGKFDVICTDPPYYDAIPYSDLMDFFHVWLRRSLHGLSQEADAAFTEPLGPKWDTERGDGELVDDAARFGGDRKASKQNYEDGMARAFVSFHESLADDGRLVIVFANKQPDAWETLVAALIRSGFVVDASWPIETERRTRLRSLSSAALSSSIWLVCRKRTATRPGWDAPVLAEMEANIAKRLHDYWDAGIRGPDFVWAATGPALEAFSRFPAVRRQDAPGEMLSVAEFLRHVRRIVVGFVVGRVLNDDRSERGALDNLTTYYLLHRRDFGLAAAPAGAVILYALSCDVSDSDLAGRWDLLARGGATTDEDSEPGGKPGGEAKLKPWDRRKSRSLGEPSPSGAPPPLIDCLHRLMRLWKTGEQSRVDAYIDARGLWNHELFRQVAQAVLERAESGTEERALLESIQNHLTARGGAAAPRYAGTI